MTRVTQRRHSRSDRQPPGGDATVEKAGLYGLDRYARSGKIGAGGHENPLNPSGPRTLCRAIVSSRLYLVKKFGLLVGA